LVIAAQSGDVEVAKLLAESGVDINLGRSPTETPLHDAKTTLYWFVSAENPFHITMFSLITWNIHTTIPSAVNLRKD